MILRLMIVSAWAVLALMAPARLTAQPLSYTITDLGPAGNPFSLGNDVNNHGVVTGSATVFDGVAARSHAVLWSRNLYWDLKQLADVRQPGMLGPNSAAGPVNESGQVAIGGETFLADPNNENFCGFGTGLQCVVFLWNKGVLTQLSNPLGGTNSGWGWMNNRGELAGFAENTARDPECLATPPNGTGPQALDYEAVIWGPGPNQFRKLKPLDGDTVGIALGINDVGQTVGVSGRCGNTVIPPFVAGPHSVLWEADGSVHDLGGFGGTSNPSVLAVGNAAVAINNQGVVVGTSALPGDQVNQPFIWTRAQRIQHLALLPGDVVGAGLAINNRGDAVGASISPGGPATGNPSAVLWANGADGRVTDLNSFLTAQSPFAALLTAFGINDAGEIVGFGLTSSGDIHAFQATPAHGVGANRVETAPKAVRRTVALSESARRLIGVRLPINKP